MIENKWKDFHVMDIYIKIVIDNSIQTANIVMQHDLLHVQPEKYNVSNEVKNSIHQQIHLTQAIQEQYKKDNNQFVSVQILLEPAQFNKLLLNITSEIQYLGFITSFFDQLKNNKEVVVDATYKTNTLEFELYAAIGQIDGYGYPIAYLFLNNAKKSDGI
ncbi:hypothetical protein RhiirA5_432547 [Rhizophagus irregularis]|uniref:Uncharacterized protein n=1 Tax=Rhizophagus irregularis TaxID=588596 RepID=A0A2N0NT41_9GLOM|nr:hypothetical protein RhiirA5_432547 [Rhizophagus irregularis]